MPDHKRMHSDVAPAPVESRARRVADGLASLARAPLDGDWLRSYVASDSAFVERVVSPAERFSTTLVLLALGDAGWSMVGDERRLDALARSFTETGVVHFFADLALLPPDVDCTVLALSALDQRGWLCPVEPSAVLDRVAENVGHDGILRVYFTDDAERGARVDPVVCINALSAFARYGREDDLRSSERFIVEFLDSDAFHTGTRYYPSADLVLYFLSRLMQFDALRSRLMPRLRRRLVQRLGQPGSPLDLAARIVAASRAGVAAPRELTRLADAQLSGGVWPAAPCFRYGRTPRYFGSEALTTAAALQALTCDPVLSAFANTGAFAHRG